MGVISTAEQLAGALFSPGRPVKLEMPETLADMQRIQKEYAAALKLLEFVQADVTGFAPELGKEEDKQGRTPQDISLAQSRDVIERLTELSDMISTGKWETFGRADSVIPNDWYRTFDSYEDAVFVTKALAIIQAAYDEDHQVRIVDKPPHNQVFVGHRYMEKLAEGEDRGPRI